MQTDLKRAILATADEKQAQTRGVVRPVQAAMPAFDGHHLSDDELDRLCELVLSRSSLDPERRPGASQQEGFDLPVDVDAGSSDMPAA